ncbi:acidobacterial duplicated orphan permease [compost metagenome]
MVKNIKDADSNFFSVFPYVFAKGDRSTALNAPKSIVMKRSLALQLFGTDNVLGKSVKIVMWRSDEGTTLKITGVVNDVSTAESVTFNAIMRTGDQDKDPDQPGNTHFSQVYALAKHEVDTSALNRALQKSYVDFKKSMFVKRKMVYDDYYKDGKTPGLKAIPLHSVHANPPFTSGWYDKIKPIIGISIFLLLVSVINFVNLATAQSVQRAKEVGVKKVLGAYKKQLVIQFLLEAAIQSLAALFISIVLVEVLLPAFGKHFDVALSFWHSDQLFGLLMQLFGVFIFLTLLAGFYPAVVLSNYNPVKVLKGNYESGFSGVVLRNGLIVLQFIIAVTFVIGIGVMHQQTRYVMNKDLGFNKERLINIATNYNRNDPFAERIKRIPGVKYVATTTQVMGNTFNVPDEITYKNQQYSVNTVTVTMDALPALGVQVLKGRIFSPEYKQDTINSVVMNETAARLLGKDIVGQQYVVNGNKEKYTFQVVGVIKDYHNEGFDKAILPTVYKVTHLGGSSNTNNLLVRFNTGQYQHLIKQIEVEWKRMYPDYPMIYRTVESDFQKSMLATQRLKQMIIVFSLISVALSLLGLFALSAFMAKRRTKEVAIRKILGASDFQIINLLNRSFMLLVLCANLISWPLAYIFMRNWLGGFAYRIDMPYWPFIIATLTSMIVAAFTVSLQARKAAVSNPVNALKYE